MKYFIAAVALIASTPVSAFAMPAGTALSARDAAVTQARVVIPPGRNANIIKVGGQAAPASHVVPPYSVKLSPSVLTTPSATSSTAAPQSHVVPPGALKLAPLLQ